MCRVRADACILSLGPHKMSVSTFMYSCPLFCVCVCEFVCVCVCPKHHDSEEESADPFA